MRASRFSSATTGAIQGVDMDTRENPGAGGPARGAGDVVLAAEQNTDGRRLCEGR